MAVRSEKDVLAGAGFGGVAGPDWRGGVGAFGSWRGDEEGGERECGYDGGAGARGAQALRWRGAELVVNRRQFYWWGDGSYFYSVMDAICGAVGECQAVW